MPPIPQLNRRQYGRLDKQDSNSERKTRAYGEKIHEKKIKNKPLKKNSASLIQYVGRFIRFILTLPFKIIWKTIKIFLITPRKKTNINSKKKKTARKKIFNTILTLIILIGISGTVAVAWISKDLPDPDKLTDRQIAQSTKIYDKTGEHLLYEIFTDQKRTLVDLNDIPQDLINAVIATEDTEFYKHMGIRPLSIARAIVYGIVSKKRIGGTSTLTQQLVKNAILTNERTVTRKIKEIILSIRLEQKYSKRQILKIYFNEIPYGSTNYGVESAAQSYFGKSVSELNLEQIATLAGMPKAPSRYLRDKTALKNRRDFVIERMFEEGFLTREEADATQAQEPSLKQNIGDITAPHFVFYVKEQVAKKFGEQAVNTGGLSIITTLDWDKQKIAEKAIKEESERLFKEANANNAAMVAINPRNGHILAYVGSKDFNDDDINGKFDVVSQGNRQPGSSFKPIVYAAAFEKGYTPQTVLFDVETNFALSGKDYKPKNYDLKEHGLITMRKALQGSLNIPAVKTLYLVGAEKGVEFAERLGYTTLGRGDFGLSLVLGGGEVKLLDHVSAYGVFANNGIKHKPVAVLKVEDGNGNVIYEWKKTRGKRVIEKEIAAVISDVLSDDEARSYAFGSNGVLTLPDRPVAAKTGTTNSYADAWTVGYTPSLVAGVWVGNTDNTPMKRGYGGSKVAAPIWNRFMREALKNSPVENFPNPPKYDVSKPVLRGSQGGNGITLLVDKVTGRLATSSTPQNYIIERTYIPSHSILHYVQKDNPRGAEPDKPENDPQYEIWENAIKDWIKRKREEDPDWKIDFGEPPTEFDDIHSLELIPALNIVYPLPSSTLYSRQIDTDIRVTAPRGVTKVTYKIDERFVGVIREHPFNLNYYATKMEDGKHILTIIVEDDVGNKLKKEIPFFLKAGIEPAKVSWVGGDQTIDKNEFPKIFFLDYFKLNEIKEVRIYKQKIGEGRVLIGSITDFSNLFDNRLTFKWDDAPEIGVYNLISEIVLHDNTIKESGKIKITIK